MDFVSFIKSNLERSYFENCSLENAVFIGANLANSYFKMQQNLPLEKAQFAESKLENTRFENTNLMYSNFAHATLNQTIFENANLSFCNFHAADFNQASIRGNTNLSNVFFTDKALEVAEKFSQ